MVLRTRNGAAATTRPSVDHDNTRDTPGLMFRASPIGLHPTKELESLGTAERSLRCPNTLAVVAKESSPDSKNFNPGTKAPDPQS